MGDLERFRLDVSRKRHGRAGLGAGYDIAGVRDIAGHGRIAGSVKGQRISIRDTLAALQVPKIRVAVGNILRIDIQAALRDYCLPRSNGCPRIGIEHHGRPRHHMQAGSAKHPCP